MVVNTGDRSGSVAGTRSCASASPDTSPLPSVVMAMMRPRRAFTSCMLDSTLPYTSSLGATNTSGMCSSMRAIGPCFISAEGYPAAEMKHGPIALIDEHMPVVFVAPKDEVYAKVLSNMQEVKARRGRIIAITTQGNGDVSGLAEAQLRVPATLPLLSPVLTTIPLQLFAYHVAELRGCDVDRPRNLAKSVTVE